MEPVPARRPRRGPPRRRRARPERARPERARPGRVPPGRVRRGAAQPRRTVPSQTWPSQTWPRREPPRLAGQRLAGPNRPRPSPGRAVGRADYRADRQPGWPGRSLGRSQAGRPATRPIITLTSGPITKLTPVRARRAILASNIRDMADPIPVWPGQLASFGTGEVFVRSAPALPGAEPALFVHGLGGSSANWTDLMDELRQPPTQGQPGPALACEALDLPGFGFSPPPPDGDYSIDGHASSVIGLIEKRANWPVHLVGNSLGGSICTRVAARRPDLVRT